MINVLMIIFLVEMGTSLFLAPSGDGGVTETSFLEFLKNPQDWSISSLLSAMDSNVFLIGGATAITVGTLWMKSEFLVYAGIASIFLGFGATLFTLHQHISNIPFIAGATGATTVSTILLSGIFVYFLVTMLDFARGRD